MDAFHAVIFCGKAFKYISDGLQLHAYTFNTKFLKLTTSLFEKFLYGIFSYANPTYRDTHCTKS